MEANASRDGSHAESPNRIAELRKDSQYDNRGSSNEERPNRAGAKRHCAAGPQPAFAHHPRFPGDATDIEVGDPKISAAYYARLEGRPVTYHFHADQPFTLYLNVLVPDVADVTEDYSLTVRRDGTPWTLVSPGGTPWARYYEPFGADRYRKGPTYREEVPAGSYEVIVSNPTNNGKYVLAFGERESFPAHEMLRTLVSLSEVKQYFGKQAVSVLESPLAYVPLLALLILAAVATLFVRWLRRRRGL